MSFVFKLVIKPHVNKKVYCTLLKAYCDLNRFELWNVCMNIECRLVAECGNSSIGCLRINGMLSKMAEYYAV